ncbi:hypothetical protein [uncultured Algibacter sp.]|uniref:hypothetical protein n=1 Tax=uncultured Algibacter sp. TaxID=298659 RepID=UPI003216B529
MDNSEFSKKYWSELKPFIGDMISNAQLHSNKGEYVKKCFNDLEIKLKSYELDENNFRDIYAKLRKQIENEILRK